jgi:hypothetical protein
MRNRTLAITFLAAALLTRISGSTSTCPYDGQAAYATGNQKQIYSSAGPVQSCEYSHAINFPDGRAGRHVFWAICD